MGSENVMDDRDARPVILLTGFGPFFNYKQNPSWLALQALEKRCNDDLPCSKIKFVFRMIPVEYEAVIETLPRWWDELQPKAIIHVGVGGPCLHVEKRAYNKGYCCRDVECRVPLDNCYFESGPAYLETDFNVVRIVEEINSQSEQLECLRPAKMSLNPGKYLCGFIYYQSLFRFPGRSLFIHVPPMSDSVTAEKLAQGLKLVIDAVIKQLDHDD